MQVWIFNPFDDIPNEGKPQRFCTLADALVVEGHSVVWWSSDFSHRRKAGRLAGECEGEKVGRLAGECEGEKAGRLAGECEGEKVENLKGRGQRDPVGKFGADADLHTFVPLNFPTEASGFSLRLVVTPPYTKNISFARIWNHRVWGKQLFKDACQAIDSGET